MQAVRKSAPPAIDEPDPVWQAALRAPAGRPETPEEQALAEAALKSNDFIPSAEVSAMLARRRPHR